MFRVLRVDFSLGIGYSCLKLSLVHRLPSIHSMPPRLKVSFEQPSKNFKKPRKEEDKKSLALAEMLNYTSLMAWTIITFLAIPNDFRAKRITVI